MITFLISIIVLYYVGGFFMNVWNHHNGKKTQKMLDEMIKYNKEHGYLGD